MGVLQEYLRKIVFGLLFLYKLSIFLLFFFVLQYISYIPLLIKLEDRNVKEFIRAHSTVRFKFVVSGYYPMCILPAYGAYPL